MTHDTDPAAWVGRQQTRHDRIVVPPLQALAATLDWPDAPWVDGTPLLPLWHWLFFLPLHRASELGPDGHARRGGFLPPLPLPRRMWAGGRLEFHAPLRVGDAVERRSTIEAVSLKTGRSGPLAFVTVRHAVHAGGAPDPALVEWHDIVYRPARRPGDPEPPPRHPPQAEGTDWQRALTPDEVLLFRYSALTFNGHRIHYDRRYVTEVEGYPGLVVHGPLVITLLLDLLRRRMPAADLAALRYQAVRPCFDGRLLRLNGRPSADGRSVALWAQDADGWLTMEAQATLR